MSSGLELDVLRAGSQAVVNSNGAIDISTAESLRARLVDLVSEGVRDLVLNLEEATYVDAAGVDAIVRVFKLLSAHEGRFSVVCPHEHLVKVFDVSALSEAFRIYPTLQDAMTAS